MPNNGNQPAQNKNISQKGVDSAPSLIGKIT